MRPTLYDILGVPADADRDEIKRAWRDAADRFEPGSGASTAQFRLFNEAAEVLLDPDSRREYDAELAAQQSAGPPPAAPVQPPPSSREPAEPEGQRRTTGWSSLSRPRDDAEPAAERSPGRSNRPGLSSLSRPRSDPEPDAPDASPGRSVPVWALFALGLVAGALVGLVIWLGVDYARTSDYQDSLDDAPQAAERAAAAVLSYDYRRLEADRDAAAKFLTPDYREEYVNTFDRLVSEQATKVRARVGAEVLTSAAMVDTEGTRDPDTVRVLVFVDQTTVSTANGGQPQTALNRARFDMERVDGTWLVSAITSY